MDIALSIIAIIVSGITIAFVVIKVRSINKRVDGIASVPDELVFDIRNIEERISDLEHITADYDKSRSNNDNI